MIRKSFTITFYSPKELWAKFWNRFFWPRRKQCAEWMELVEVKLKHTIINHIIVDYYNNDLLDETVSERLELDIKKSIEKVCEEVRKVMTTPIDTPIE